MTKEDDVVFKTSEIPFPQVIGWLILGAWIAFCTQMYEVNPPFFSVTGGIALVFFLMIRVPKFIFLQDALIIKNIRIIPLLTTSHRYPYEQIQDIAFKPGSETVRLIQIITLSEPTHIFHESLDTKTDKRRLIIKAEDKPWREITGRSFFKMEKLKNIVNQVREEKIGGGSPGWVEG